MSRHSQQSGFTAVELLVTLFVAAAFLIAGYQLFNVVIKDGGQARAESRAANIAYDYLRRYSPNATYPCTSSTQVANEAVTVDGLSNVRITVQISCPNVSTTSLSKITAVVTFGNPPQSLTYSTFANGVTPQTTDITTGLIGWWKLNGNTTASIGSIDGTGYDLTPAAGQDGQFNTAWSFNGSTSYVDLPSTFGLGNTNVALSLWVNSGTATNSGGFIKISGTGYGIGMGASTFDNTSPGTKIIMLFEGVRWIPTTTDLGTGWHHIVMMLDGSGVPSAYRDGVLIGTYSGSNAVMGTGSSYIGAGSSTARRFNGTIDDVRIYNRTLTPSEITSLYTGGAK